MVPLVTEWRNGYNLFGGIGTPCLPFSDLFQSAERWLWNAAEGGPVLNFHLSVWASLLLCLPQLEGGGRGLLDPARASN